MQQNIKAYNEDSSSNEFASLLQQDLDKRVTAESSLVNGIVSRIEEKIVLIDVGLKSEGVINKSELTSEELETLKVGDELEVFIEIQKNTRKKSSRSSSCTTSTFCIHDWNLKESKLKRCVQYIRQE